MIRGEARNLKEGRERSAMMDVGADNWAISYGDMITLLLAFFVLFFNIGASSSAQIHFLQEDLKKHFTFISEDLTRKPDSVSTWGSVQSGVEELPEIVNRKMQKLPKIQTKIDGNRLLVEFPGVSFFASAQFDLTNEGERSLEQFAKTFKEYKDDFRLIVRGYTDNRPVRHLNRPFKDNLELSSKRSLSAIRALNSAGIPLELMRIGGYGETDKAGEISEKERLKYDRKIVLVVEPLDNTERGFGKGETS